MMSGDRQDIVRAGIGTAAEVLRLDFLAQEPATPMCLKATTDFYDVRRHDQLADVFCTG